MKSVFETLAAINCNEHTETKNGLTYLSWAWAWNIVKREFPDAQYTIYETAEQRPYFDDGRTAWVKTGVTINGLEHIEYLPIMDYNNHSIPVAKVTSFDMNKAIQRSLTKACARHGLGLYIYAGEDLPEVADAAPQEEKPQASKKRATKTNEAPAPRRFENYDGWVKAIALGKTKDGKSAKQMFIDAFAPTIDELEALENAVTEYKINNNL